MFLRISKIKTDYNNGFYLRQPKVLRSAPINKGNGSLTLCKRRCVGFCTLKAYKVKFKSEKHAKFYVNQYLVLETTWGIMRSNYLQDKSRVYTVCLVLEIVKLPTSRVSIWIQILGSTCQKNRQFHINMQPWKQQNSI